MNIGKTFTPQVLEDLSPKNPLNLLARALGSPNVSTETSSEKNRGGKRGRANSYGLTRGKTLKCHLCRERMMQSRLLICKNYSSCRGSFCIQCLHKLLTNQEHPEQMKKNHKNWICLLCRGQCHCQLCSYNILKEFDKIGEKHRIEPPEIHYKIHKKVKKCKTLKKLVKPLSVINRKRREPHKSLPSIPVQYCPRPSSAVEKVISNSQNTPAQTLGKLPNLEPLICDLPRSVQSSLPQYNPLPSICPRNYNIENPREQYLGAPFQSYNGSMNYPAFNYDEQYYSYPYLANTPEVSGWAPRIETFPSMNQEFQYPYSIQQYPGQFPY